jgi:pyrimidine-nucleoside phosphorylase
MRAVDIIRKKRDGLRLDRAEIDYFVHGVTAQTWPDYQISALLMAVWLRGMDAEETAALTRAMAYSGQRLDLSDIPGPKIDKHSTGGVGDKTSLILAPLAAACGLYVPMMSGRGLGHTGGTLDKLESIPGFRVHLDLAEFKAVLREVGCAMIGQTTDIAPADRVLYALRDVTATVESIPLITASIMSKKIAEGIDGLVLDVKSGRGAFKKVRAQARLLADSLVAAGNADGLRTETLLTNMDAPLGYAVGNAVEVEECIQTLRGNGPADLEELSVKLAAHMVRLAGIKATNEAAEAEVRDVLDSGRGLEQFRELVQHQGGDPAIVDEPKRLPQAAHSVTVNADRPGYVTAIDAEKVGVATMLLGAGRERLDQKIDPGVGAILRTKPGMKVREGDALVEARYRPEARLGVALEMLRQAWMIGDEPPAAAHLILEEITA